MGTEGVDERALATIQGAQSLQDVADAVATEAARADAVQPLPDLPPGREHGR
jgi:hypothetical protein